MKRSIGVVTTARSDYTAYRPILQRIRADPDLDLKLFVGGAHLAPRLGLTVRDIEADGFPIAERVDLLLASDSPEGVAKSLGLGVIGFAQALSRTRPDVLLVLGDRFEMLAAVAAALPLGIPVAHVHGGEATVGAMDESIRHAITKLSHLHFAATQVYADRIVQMGEAPWRVAVSGAPALDVLPQLTPADPVRFARAYNVRLSPPPVLVTYHPVTLELDRLAEQVDALLGALDDAGVPVIFTEPNADPGGHVIRERLAAYLANRERAWLVPNFGAAGYFDALRLCAAMVGNSSSGIIEAPSFALPVVNVGTRQDGRLRAANVIDVGYGRRDIAAAIRRALAPEFRASLRGVPNPYGDGLAAERIVARLRAVPLDDRLLRKVFADVERRS